MGRKVDGHAGCYDVTDQRIDVVLLADFLVCYVHPSIREATVSNVARLVVTAAFPTGFASDRDEADNFQGLALFALGMNVSAT